MAFGKTDRVVSFISAEHKKSLPSYIYGNMKAARDRNRRVSAVWKRFKENHKVKKAG